MALRPVVESDSSQSLWRPFVYIVGGLLLTIAAAVFADRTGLAVKFKLDAQGVRASGEAEHLDRGAYRIRYTHPGGTIVTRTFMHGEGYLNVTAEKPVPVDIVYNPGDPNEFQLAGQSYVPGAATFTLLIVGLGGVVYGNRRLRRIRIKGPTTARPVR